MTDETKARLSKLPDNEIIEVWLAAGDPENPTPDETAALELMEERDLDF